MARFHPSFRGRLRLFFAVIVIVPMIAVGFVLFQLVTQADQEQLDARLSEAGNGANAMLVEDRQQAGVAANGLTQDAAFSAALQARRAQAIKTRLDTLL